MPAERTSLYFEDFKKGTVFRSKDRLICEDDISQFAELSGDVNPIHLDEDFARNSIYGERIAHGLLTLSLVSGLAVETGIAERTTVAFKSLEWRFKKPVMIGDSIRAEFKVMDRRSLPGHSEGLVVFRVQVFNQAGALVESGKWSLVIKSRGKD